MPVHNSPGVYVDEVPSGVRSITGVDTSITAFVGRTWRGPTDTPVRVHSFDDYERELGGLWERSTVSYAVQHFFLNGGREALVVRIHHGATAATIGVAAGPTTIPLRAADEGSWGNELYLTVDHTVADGDESTCFDLTVEEIPAGATSPTATEVHREVSVDPSSARFVPDVLADKSRLVRIGGAVPAGRPEEVHRQRFTGGHDGLEVADADLSDPTLAGTQSGLWALEKAELFNILCVPPLARMVDIGAPTRDAAAALAKAHRAMYLMDAPAEWTVADAVQDLDSLRTGNDENVAAYFPRIELPDPLDADQLHSFAPCGAVAGVYARTDAHRGVWKAPAGREAVLVGVQRPTVSLADGEQDALNPLGLNALRTFPSVGTVAWGARTLHVAERLVSQWKYVPVRRLALFLEESLYRGTQWAAFEPNDEALWAQLRLNVGAFLLGLFRQGAFQGTSPRDGYLVKCDEETTTPTDRADGRVNILVGFAPLKPAEFVIIQISQRVGADEG